MRVIDHWLERWLRWEDRRRRAKSLSYSIRRCHPDEIEIHPSVNDGLTRGFFRCTLFCAMLVILIVDSRHGIDTFSDFKQSLKRDYEWAFNLESIVRVRYEDREKKGFFRNRRVNLLQGEK